MSRLSAFDIPGCLAASGKGGQKWSTCRTRKNGWLVHCYDGYRPPLDSVQLVNITPITMVLWYANNELVTGASLDQLITGGPHIVAIGTSW